MTIYDGRIKRAVGNILTAIGLGGSSADTIEAVFEREHVAAAQRDLHFAAPLNLMMARTLRPGNSVLLDRL